MNNEETILDSQSVTESNSSEANAPVVKNNSNPSGKEGSKSKKNNGFIEKSAFAAGGFVAGAASVSAVDAVASVLSNKETADEAPVTAEEKPEVNPADSPSEQEAIITTDEGVRVAQVDDDKSFSEAFADARAQVGPGGVFEWHGKVYGTFYANEWEQMSAEERAAWQAKVDYDDVLEQGESHHENYHQESHTSNHTANAHNTSLHEEPQPQESEISNSSVEVVEVGQVDLDGNGTPETAAVLSNGVILVDIDNDGTADVAMMDVNQNGQLDDGEAVNVTAEHIAMPQASNDTMYASQSTDDGDVEVHVLNVGQADLNGDGMVENVAVVEIDGNEVMLVDIDQDNEADVIIADLNGDGQLQENEIGDITDQHLDMPTMSDGDVYMASADAEPDYMNDADMGLYEA